MAVKNLSSLIVSSSFNRLLQVNPDDNIGIIDGTGSIFLISTSSIRNWSADVNSTVSALGYLTETGVVFTSKSNTGSILLKGDIEVTGDIKLFSGSNEVMTFDNSGYMKLTQYTGDMGSLTGGSMIYSGSDFFFVSE